MPFAVGGVGRPKVGHRSTGDPQVHVAPARLHRLVHFHGCGHVDAPVNPLRGGQGHGAGDKRHQRALVGEGRGQCEAHLPTAPVAQKAYGVERLVGGARCDEHLFSGQGKGLLEVCFDVVGDVLRFRHASLADQAAGQGASAGVDDVHPARFEDAKVVLGGSMCEHVQVHGWGHGHGAARAEEHGLQQVLALAMHHGRQGVGGGGGHDDEVAPNAQFHVVGPHAGVLVFREVGMHGPVDQRGQRQRRDEFGGACGHHHTHLRTSALQFTRQRGAFVRGNAPGDAQDNASSRKGERRRGQFHGRPCLGVELLGA